MRLYQWFLLAFCVAGWAGSAAARDLDLAPSSKWVLSYSPDGCTLARSFGEGEDTVIVQFVKIDIGPGFEFNLKGKPIKVWRHRPRIDLRFGDTGYFVSKTAIDILSDDPLEPLAMRMGGRFDNFDWSRRSYGSMTRTEKTRMLHVDPAIAGGIDKVTIKGGGLTLNLKTGSMRAPAASLNKCSEDLVASWGFDPQKIKELAMHPEPIGSLGEWFKGLGPRYLRYRDQADLAYRLKVDEKGVPTECMLLSAVGKKSIADALCNQLVKKARFWPAETKDGTRVPAYYVGGVFYLW